MRRKENTVGKCSLHVQHSFTFMHDIILSLVSLYCRYRWHNFEVMIALLWIWNNYQRERDIEGDERRGFGQLLWVRDFEKRGRCQKRIFMRLFCGSYGIILPPTLPPAVSFKETWKIWGPAMAGHRVLHSGDRRWDWPGGPGQLTCILGSPVCCTLCGSLYFSCYPLVRMCF